MVLELELSISLAGLGVQNSFFTHHVWHLSWNSWNCYGLIRYLSLHGFFMWLTWSLHNATVSGGWASCISLGNPPPHSRVSVLRRQGKSCKAFYDLAQQSRSITSATCFWLTRDQPTLTLERNFTGTRMPEGCVQCEEKEVTVKKDI